MAALSFQQVVAVPAAGLTYSAATAGAGGDTCPWDDGLACIVKNAGGTQDVVTVVTPGNGPGGVATPDVPAATVPITTGERLIFLGDPAYMDPTTGLVTVTHSFVTSVTIAFIRVG